MSSFLIEDAYYIIGIGTILVGTVKGGVLKPGMRARIDSRVIEAKSIEKNHVQLSEAKMGENVAINIKQLEPKIGFFAKMSSGNKLYNDFKNYKGRQVEFT